MQLSIFIPDVNLTKILLLDVVIVDAVVMDEAMELVNPFTSVSGITSSTRNG